MAPALDEWLRTKTVQRMKRFAAVAGLIVLYGTACATVPTRSVEARLAGAQKAIEEGSQFEEAEQYPQAEARYEHALVALEEVLGAMNPAVAPALTSLARLYETQGYYARAQPLYERALTIVSVDRDKSTRVLAAALTNLARLYETQGQYARAESRYEHALEIEEETFGKNHPDVAPTLIDLARIYRSQGHYARAEPLLQRALELREEAFGKGDPLVAAALGNLARLYETQGHYAPAGSLYERALTIWEHAFGKNHPYVVPPLIYLARLYRAQGQYARAEPLLERALALQQKAFGESHPKIISPLNNLAYLYQAQGHYPRAEPMYERALAIEEKALGKHHPDVAIALTNLAFLYQELGHYARAEPLYERALAIEEGTFGKKHPDVACSLSRLADLYQAQGRYEEAEQVYQRALAIRKEALGEHHPDVAIALNDLAILYQVQGRNEEAQPLYERALEVREKRLGKNHPEVATTLSTFAFFYAAQGRNEQARPLYERALGIREEALGKNHPEVAIALSNLADIYQAQGHYERAEPLYERALAIRQEALGQDHPDVASSLDNLAYFYRVQEQYARAKPLYARVLTIREAAFGKSHPDVARSLNNLARLHLAQRHLDEALPLLARAFTISEEHLRQEVFGLSEARLAGALNLLREEEEFLYALVRTYPEDSRVRQLALSATLLRKGRSVEELAATSRIIYRSLEQTERDNFEKLRALRTQYSTLSLSGPGSISPDDHQQRLAEIDQRGDVIEAGLAKHSAPLRALIALPAPTEIIDRVAAALPRDSVLVELVAYHDKPLVPWLGSALQRQRGELCYLAFLLFADGRTSAVDLGPAAAIDRTAQRLHHALASRALDYRVAAQTLYQLAFRPLVSHLGNVRRLFLSPDGQLAMVPFAALHDGRHFLVETLDITYLTSGKDILPRSQDIPSAHSVVVLADPDFDSSLAALPESGEGAPLQRSVPFARLFSSLRAELGDKSWGALPGTRQEAEAIQRLFPHARLLLGRAATKSALLRVARPGILHIATHGFFLKNSAAPAATRSLMSIGSVGDAGPQHDLPDPMLRSGLVLASAHDGSHGSEDSLVTALELASLDLWGTRLVVLSACDTGRGDILPGQGVYGLRRALVVAGAETVVTSLWKVNDEATRELMEGYYNGLLAGQGRATALREAMRTFREKQPHPYYWAPFIAIGKDTPLGKLEPTTEPPPAEPSDIEYPEFPTPFTLLHRLADSPVLYQFEFVDFPRSGWADQLWPRVAGFVQRPQVMEKKGMIMLGEWPEDPEERRLRLEAEPHIKAGRYAEVAQLYAQVTGRCPECYMGWLFRGDGALSSGDVTTALSHFERATELNPYDHRSHFCRGRALSLLGRHQEARDAWAWSLVNYPRDPAIRHFFTKNPETGFVINEDIVIPRGNVRKEGNTVFVYMHRDYSAWTTYAQCKALWLGDPSYRQEKTGSTEHRFTSTEELECLGSLLLGYENLLENQQREGKEIQKDASLERLQTILQDKMIIELIFFEIFARLYPQVTLTLGEKTRKQLHTYVLKYVLVPRPSP